MATKRKNGKEPNKRVIKKKNTVSTDNQGMDIFPVVGIGASAGGLEALSDLFKNMPGNTGAAFVVVQHLTPDRESNMSELLQRSTRMPAHQVSDNMKIEPDKIYLIPPGKNMSIVNGTLQLLEQIEPSGIRHPIDFFFKSLAEDRHAGANGIILSGTGTDGTAGARIIKAELGLVIAQDPEEAKYDGMPRSLIDNGLTDYVLPTAEIPELVKDYIQKIPEVIAASRESPDDLARVLPKIIALIRNETGNDFSSYKENTLLRRIKRRMAIHRISDGPDYVRFLQENPKETTVLFKELLINVTSFFRDKEAFEVLKAALKERLAKKPRQEEVRAWVVGCATGEEAYSVAIILREIMDELGRDHKVQVFGTDLDNDAIEIARNGVYRANIADDVPSGRLERFFIKKDDSYQVKMEIREMVVFATHNLIKEPPFLRMDLISARNLLIYLKGDLQKKLLPVFHYSLREYGLLFLSPSETVGEFTDLFESIDRKWKLYQARPGANGGGYLPPFLVEPAGRGRRGEQKGNGELKESDIPQITDRMLISEYSPPYVVVDGADNIVYVRGDTDPYLKFAEGKATMNIQEIVRRGLRSHVSLAIRRARSKKEEVRREGIEVYAPNSLFVGITVRPVMLQKQATDYLMIVFSKSAPREEPTTTGGKGAREGKRKKPSESAQHILELEQELKRSREDLQSTIEELETSNEELKSSNEELLSSNEELQSTNEELETSREELRSLNEELTTLNQENQERIELLNQSQDDMRNLLNTIDIATVFLDTDLNINSFTPAATRLFSLRDGDVGRPFGEISSSLDYESLMDDVRKVLDTLVKQERDLKAKDGRWYSVRIFPYRTKENEITGVVLTFVDVDDKRILEAALDYTKNIVDTVREPMLVLDKDLKVVSANRSFYQQFRVNEEETQGQHVYELGNGQWDIPQLRKLLEEIIPKNSHFNNFAVEHDFPVIGPRKMLLNARRLYNETGSERILLAIEDVTDRPQAGRHFQGEQK
jgi:two-component system CheB/CheR fusion protein